MPRHFDGSPRAPKPTGRDLAVGAFSEFVAMTLFVFFGCGAAASNAHFKRNGELHEWDSASVTVISLQFGLGITVLAYAVAHTSGAHINCAVTLALMIVGTCHPLRAIVYFAAQMLGSVCGAALLHAATAPSIDRTGGLGANGLQNAEVTIGNALVAEVMGTFLLVYVVLETAVNVNSVVGDDAKMIRGTKQTLAPLPIGLAVFMAHVLCVPITGCSINPTRSFGPSLVADVWDDHWLWWVGPCLGATLASLTWLLLKTIERAPSVPDDVPEEGGGDDKQKTAAAKNNKVAPPPPVRHQHDNDQTVCYVEPI